MQEKEKEMRAGGREKYAIKVIESAGNTVERMLVKTDPFNGNKCGDENCVVSKDPENKINCRKNNVGYSMECKICQRNGGSTKYFGETGKNMHCRCKEHISKFNSKQEKTKMESAFIKHLVNKHEDVDINHVKFEDVFSVKVVRAYSKVLTRCVDEGTFIAEHKGELLNSKSEWHQPSIIRNVIVSGGAEVVGGEQGRGRGGQDGGGRVEGGVDVEVGAGGGAGGVARAPGTGVASRTRSRRAIGQGGRVGGAS